MNTNDPLPASPTPDPQHVARDSRRANLALAIAGFACFALLYGTQPVLPQLAQAFDISPGAASLSVSAGTAALALLLIPFSLIADRYGRRHLMCFGLFGATLFSLASAAAPDYMLLLLCRAGVGACIAGVPAAAMAYIGEEIPLDGRSRAMGMYIAANALGGMCGRFLSALLTDWLNWRIGLAALGLLGVAAAIAFARLLPVGRHFVPRSLEPRVLIADVRQIYSDAGLPWLFLIAFLIMGSFVGTYNYLGFRLGLPPYALGPAAVGAIFLLYAVGSISSTLAGLVAMRFGYARILALMSLCMVVGILTTLANSLPAIVFGLAVFTFGYFAVHAAASGWVARRAGSRRGLVSALYLSSYYLGGSVIGSAAGWPWLHGGWPGVVVALLLCSAGVIAIVIRLRKLGDG